VALGLASVVPVYAADPSFTLSGTTPAAGFELVDRGVMVMRGSRSASRPSFAGSAMH